VQFCISPVRVVRDKRGRGSHLMLPMALAMLSALTQRPPRQDTAVLGELAFGGLCVPQLAAGVWPTHILTP
jgi:predicted ATPase with chaperone activity